jgi:hypothetical protein
VNGESGESIGDTAYCLQLTAYFVAHSKGVLLLAISVAVTVNQGVTVTI